VKHPPLTPENSHQLSLELVHNDVADDAGERRISMAEAELISSSAREALDAGSALGSGKEPPAWFQDYRELREDGWPWRVACYIAWCSSPRVGRWPTTQKSLSQDVLGLRSDRVIRAWREKNPAIEAAIGMLQAKALFEHRRDVLNALITSASTPDHLNHQDRKLFLEMTGDYTPKQEIERRMKVGQDDLSQMSDAELLEAGGVVEAELQARTGGETEE